VTAVWYAAYGSNLDPDRLAVYLDACRDRRRPEATGAAVADHQLRFGGSSTRWGGGVAFLDPSPGSGRALVRRWLVTAEQLADVYAQENGRPVGSVEVDLGALDDAGHVDGLPGRYGRLVHLGHHAERPVVTFTAAEPPPAAAPSVAYLARLVVGLRQAHRLDDDAIVSYLLAAPGVSAAWTGESLASAMRHGPG
jgi:hypothetical protein